MAHLEWSTAVVLYSIVFAFMTGAFVSGVITGDSKFKLGRRYGVVLLLESLMLLLSFLLLTGK